MAAFPEVLATEGLAALKKAGQPWSGDTALYEGGFREKIPIGRGHVDGS